MKISRWALSHAKIVYFLLFAAIAGGTIGFDRLGKKEDAVFVIKSAALSCNYPGASPEEVEQLITEPIEREIQSMRSVYKITSESRYGQSRILVELDPATPAREIEQLWDELRRRTLNAASQLPEGASAISVSDDFGDVYGIYYALSADEGFSWSELREWAQRIKTRLAAVEGISQIVLYGEQQPVVNVYISPAALAGFSIRPEAIISTIGRQNALISNGLKQAGALEIEILESSTYRSLNDLRNQLLMASDGKQYRLGDIARVEQGYRSPPVSLMRVGGERAIGIGVSTEAQADVVKAGRRLTAELNALEAEMPVGLTLSVLYPEDRIAREATNAFLINLAESIAIVIVLLMAVMGLRAGILIGSSLLFSIGATLLFMQPLGEGLNRTSLAGFIIAMGMLVDNAIVVVDNARQGMLRGMDRTEALVAGAEAPKWSLLGATLIGIFSFLPLYLAPSSVAEIVKPLFVVLALSLTISWVLALTQTPLFGMLLLKPVHAPRDNRANRFQRVFSRMLAALLRHRWSVAAVTVMLFFGSLWVMKRLPQNFFPELDKPYFRADILLPEGYSIHYTEQTLAEMESWLRAQSEVKRVSFTAGGTPPRYYLASRSVSGRGNFGNLLVELHDKHHTAEVESRFAAYVEANWPNVWLRSSLFKLSPVPDAAIEFGFIGRSADTLLSLAARALKIMRDTPGTENVRISWGNRIPTWMPVYSQMKGQRIGISRSELAAGLTVATAGYRLGEYREGDQFMPILLRDENTVDYNLTNLQAMPVFSPAGRVYSIEQAVDSFRFDFRTGLVERYNRQRVVKAQCDPARGINTKQLFSELNSSIGRIPLPEGYSLKIFGEQESQEDSVSALRANMPLTALLILTVLLLLFGNYRNPVIVLMMLPLIFIGVVMGIAVTGKIFDFFSLLGLLGLAGMNIKNSVVLIERIEELRRSGLKPYAALTEAARSRVVPVVMASGTTILGMLPLLCDSLFGAMAATIMGGLLVATLLVVFVLPAVYAIVHRIQPSKVHET